MSPKLILPIFLLFSSQIYSQLNVGLEAQFYFNNGNAVADVGGINGVVNSANLTSDRFGCENSAYNFDPNSSSNISLGDSFDSFITGPDAQFSISFWFNTRGIANGSAPMFVKYAHAPCSESQREFGAEINQSGFYSFYFASDLQGSNYMVVQGSTIIADSNWHHIVIIYDGTIDSNNGIDRVQMFLDNQPQIITEEASNGTTSEIQDGTAHTGIGGILSSTGANCNGGIPHYSGDLDDYRLYSKLLSVQEVDSLFNEITGCALNFNNPTDFEVNIFPNPTTNVLNIQFSGITHYSTVYHIYDISGKLIDSDQFMGTSTSIGIENLSKGTYILELCSSQFGLMERRLFKKN
ncbi:MAG: T9SS type A sorting domain-containing protein [Crocinitomicaceae bacterium]|nr:T9SS type A sorting domain-containing protein [Crocinitomicaceae bacterium]